VQKCHMYVRAARSQFCECFMSALCVSVLPKEKLLRFRFKEVTLGYLACKYVVMVHDLCHML
jgi:hypothetical protein